MCAGIIMEENNVNCNNDRKQNEINEPIDLVKKEIPYDYGVGVVLEDLDVDKRNRKDIATEGENAENKNEFRIEGVNSFDYHDNLHKQELANMQELNLHLHFLDNQFNVKEESVDECDEEETFQFGVWDKNFVNDETEYAEVQARNTEMFESEDFGTLRSVKEEMVYESVEEVKVESGGDDITGQQLIRIKTTQELCGTYIYDSSYPQNLSNNYVLNLGAKQKRVRKKRPVDANKVNMQSEQRELKYKCEVCGKAFMWKSYLKSHEISHSNERPYECEVCGKSFSQKSVITRHMEKLHNMTPKPKIPIERKYNCELCSKVFLSRGYLNIHIRAHTGERPFACEICGKRFTQKIAMQNHMRSMHITEPQFTCKICGKAFRMKYSLTLHEQLHTTLPLACEVCGKAFGHKLALKQHMTYMHDKPQACTEQPLKCQICSKSFASKNGLQRHERIHTEQRSFMCEVCGMSFWSNYELKMHIINRHGETRAYADNPLKCEICSKGFARKALLDRHQRMHTKENPFPCDVCGKKFRHKFSVKAHVKKFHSDIK